jgi:AAA domain-containing protein
MSPSNASNASLKIITADERLKETRGIKGVLTGISGIGKTSQLWTLDPAHTLFLNLEAGELAVQGWPGDEIRIRDWETDTPSRWQGHWNCRRSACQSRPMFWVSGLATGTATARRSLRIVTIWKSLNICVRAALMWRSGRRTKGFRTL